MIGAPKMINRLIGPTSDLTNTASETVMDSYVFPANFWVTGKIVHWSGLVLQKAVNGTDTLRTRARLGPTTLTGTTVADSGAVTGAANNVWRWDIWMCAISTSEIRTWGAYSVLGGIGTATLRATHVAVTSLDLTVAQRAEITGLYSAASASNTAVVVGNVLVEYN